MWLSDNHNKTQGTIDDETYVLIFHTSREDWQSFCISISPIHWNRTCNCVQFEQLFARKDSFGRIFVCGFAWREECREYFEFHYTQQSWHRVPSLPFFPPPICSFFFCLLSLFSLKDEQPHDSQGRRSQDDQQPNLTYTTCFLFLKVSIFTEVFFRWLFKSERPPMDKRRNCWPLRIRKRCQRRYMDKPAGFPRRTRNHWVCRRRWSSKNVLRPKQRLGDVQKEPRIPQDGNVYWASLRHSG